MKVKNFYLVLRLSIVDQNTATETLQASERPVALICSFALKSSENVFRKHFETIVKWSKITHEYDTPDADLMNRKLAVMQLLNGLVKTLGRFGINYYGALYDYFIGFLEHLISVAVPASHGKRSAPSASAELVALHCLVLESLALLFKHDKKGFIDNLRFEKLVKPLSHQLKLFSLSDDWAAYAQSHVIPAVVGLVQLAADDFMWKSVLHHVCSLLRIDSIAVRKAVALCCSQIVDALAERFVVVLNNFVPHLATLLDDEEPEISALGRSIAKQINQYSSEDIFALIKQSV